MEKIANKLLTAAVGLTTAHSAQAAIFYTDTSSAGLTLGTGSGSSIYIDFDSMSASSSNPDGVDITINGKPGSAEGAYVDPLGVWSLFSDSGDLAKFAEGAPISGSLTSGTSQFFESPWNAPNDGIGYFGVTNGTGSMNGWVKVDYNDAADTIQLLGFAYNDNGPINAGQTAIPEPASAAAAAALLAGGVAAFRRRENRTA